MSDILIRSNLRITTLVTVFILCGILLTGAVGAVENTTAEQTSNEVITVEQGESIQDAIDAATAGDTIEVAEGTYEEAITIDTQVTIVAPDGAELDGIDSDDAVGVTITAADVTVSDLEIRRFATGMVVQNSGATIDDVNIRLNDGDAIDASDSAVTSLTVQDSVLDDNDGTGLDVSGGNVDTLTVSDTEISESSGSGIEVTDATSITIEGVDLVRNGENGIFTEDVVSVSITDVEAVQNGNTGIALETDILLGTDIEIAETTARLNDGNGLDIQDTSDPDSVAVMDSRFTENEGVGASIDADTVTVENTVLTDNEAAGLEITGTTVAVTDSTVSDNTDTASFQADGYGIVVEDAEDVTLTDVEARNNADSNIQIQGDAQARETTLTNVSADRAQSGSTIAIRSSDGDDEITISNVSANNGEGSGMNLRAETVTVEDVTATENANTGIRIVGTTASVVNSTVSDNTDDASTTADGYGILVEDAEDVTLTDVEARSNSGNNIRIEGDSRIRETTLTNISADRAESQSGVYITSADEDDEITISNVTANNNQQRGLNIHAETITVEDVTATDNEDTGLEITGTTVTVTDSIVSDNTDTASTGADGYGILVEDAEDVTLTDIEARSNYGSNIQIEGESDTRQTTLTNVSADRTDSGSAVQVRSAQEDDEITLSNVSANHADNKGLNLNAETITVTDISATDNGDGGVSVAGEVVSVSNAVINDNEGFGFNPDGYGLWIEDAETVTLDTIETISNERNNVYIDGEDVSDRTIEVTNLTAERTDDDRHGVWITPTSGSDSVTIADSESIASGFSGFAVRAGTISIDNVTSSQNSGEGFIFDADQVSVTNSTVTDNGDVGLRFESLSEESTVLQNIIADNADHQLVNEEEDVSINASENNWGPAGVDDETCVGNADCGEDEEAVPELDINGNGQPATDTTGDGLLDDITGSGDSSVLDVQALFTNFENDDVQNNQELFDFADNGDVSILDVQALFQEVSS